MMISKEPFPLIRGTFAPSEAADVLFKLISGKINYHLLLLFSNEERFGSDLANSRVRIKQLKAMREELAEIIQDARENGYDLDIHSDIRITKAETVNERS